MTPLTRPLWPPLRFSRALMGMLLVWLFTSVSQASSSISAAPDVEGYAHTLDPAPPDPEGWIIEHGLYARVHAPENDWRIARRISRHATEAIPRIAEDLGVSAGPTMDIFIAPDARSFAALQPGDSPEWADGTAWPHRGLIYLHNPRDRDGTAPPLEQVLEHEIVHVVLGQAFGPHPVPRWLQEGIAQIEAREYRPETTKALAGGVLGDSLLAIEDITQRFPADPVRAQLAYAQSADLIAYIQNTYGREAVRTIVHEMSRGRPVGAALRAATGRSLMDLDAEWRSEIRNSHLWLKPLVSNDAILGSAGLAFIIASVFALRRRRRRLAAWGREEARQDAYADALRRQLALEASRRSAASSATPSGFDHPVPGLSEQPDPLDTIH